MTLERCADGSFYELCRNLRLSGATVDELYDAAQMTFRERISPISAEKKIQELIAKPAHMELTPNLHSIYQLVSVKYDESPSATRELETVFESIAKTFEFLQRNYGLKRTEQVRVKFENYKSRLATVSGHGLYGGMSPYSIFLKLVAYAETLLRTEGLQPTNRGLSSGQEKMLKEAMSFIDEDVSESEQPDDQQGCSALDQLRQRQFVQGKQFNQGARNPQPQKPMAPMPAQLQDKCYLCGNGADIHRPIWFKKCTLFPGEQPLLIAQQCCGGHHRDLGGKMCPSVEARKRLPQRVNSLADDELAAFEAEAASSSFKYSSAGN
jgi:hypothetical protein